MACPLCGSPHADPLFQGVGFPAWAPETPTEFSVVLCRECGLGYQRAALEPGYARESAQGYAGFDKNRHFPFPRQSEENLRTRDLLLDALAGREAPNVLEIGANRGDMLALLKRARPELNILGIDPARCEHSSLPVVHACFDPALFSPCFHLVAMQHVLEHVADPVGFLRAATSVLAPGGALYVEVPHLGNALAARVDDFSPEHVCYFTPATLVLALQRACGAMPAVRLDTDGFLRLLAYPGQAPGDPAPALPDGAGAGNLSALARDYAQARSRLMGYVREQAAAGRRVVFYGVAYYFRVLFQALRPGLDPGRCAFLDDEFPGEREPSYGLPRAGSVGPGDLVLTCSPNPGVQDRMAARLAGSGAEVLQPWRGVAGEGGRC